MTDDDAALVEACLAGEATGLRAFVERFQGMVFGLCFRMLGQREDAEDVVQEVFLRAFRSLSGWDSSRPLKPWLFAIAANRCRTHLQKRSRLPIPSEVVEQISEGEPLSVAREIAEEIQLGLSRLREEYRTCFELFHLQELSCAEIGEILGSPEGTIKTWLHRARRELALHLERRGLTTDTRYEQQRL